MTIDLENQAAAGVRYAYRASLVGSAHLFELTDHGMSWQAGGRSGLWRYDEISAIRLSFRPVSMQARRFRADIDRAGGGRIRILSTTWQTATLMAPQDNDYRAFITGLHQRMAETGSRAALIGGLGPRVYAAAIILLVLVGIAIAGLLVRALGTGEFAGVLFLVGFAALFGWQIGGFVTRNRPRMYTFDDLPKALLP
jgi:hypothetical protein